MAPVSGLAQTGNSNHEIQPHLRQVWSVQIQVVSGTPWEKITTGFLLSCFPCPPPPLLTHLTHCPWPLELTKEKRVGGIEGKFWRLQLLPKTWHLSLAKMSIWVPDPLLYGFRKLESSISLHIKHLVCLMLIPPPHYFKWINKYIETQRSQVVCY